MITPFLALVCLGGEWTIDYTTTVEGPRTVYRGTVWLHRTEESLHPCMSHCFDVPEGRLTGSSISSNPGYPMIPFDWYEHREGELEFVWCAPPINPNQYLPVYTPRNFSFHIVKTKFNADDLAQLLTDWGPPSIVDATWPETDYTLVSPWDLNGDTVVDGKDLSILLAGWSIE